MALSGFTTVKDRVPLVPFAGAKYATAPLLPTTQFNKDETYQLERQQLILEK
jgi:hypothetical protein